MKPAIILNMMGQRGVKAVAKAILEKVDVEFITMEPISSYLANEGIPQKFYGQYVPDNDEGITSEVQRRLELFESTVNENTFREQYPFFDDISWKQVLQRLRDVVHREMLNNMITMEATRRCAANNDLRLVVSSEDVLPVTRTMIATAKELGIPSLHIIHSVPSGQITTHPASTSTYVATYSEFTKKKYESLGIPGKDILVTGNPAWDRLVRPPLPKHRIQLCEKLGLDPNEPVITYAWTHFTTWTVELAARPKVHIHHAEAVLNAFIELSKKHPTWQFAMRPRPYAETDKIVENMLVRAKDQGLENIFFDKQPPYDCLVLSDVLVSTESNMNIEAILLGKQSVCVNLPEYWGDALQEGFGELFDERDAAIKVDKADDIASAIESAILDPEIHDRFYEARNYSIDKFNRNNAGRAVDNVARAIAAIVNTGKVAQKNVDNTESESVSLSPYALAQVQQLDEADVLNRSGEERFNAGDFPGSVKDFVAAISIRHDQALYYSNMGTALHALGNNEEAWEQLIKALHFDPHLEITRENLREFAKDLGRIEEAEHILSLFGRDN